MAGNNQSTSVLDLDGKAKGSVALPAAFGEEIREDLIRRAVAAENSLELQPQGHYLLAGMNTTARYYGAMNSYRAGRHQGVAIRPRQKLGGGQQGQVRRIPSAVKGKRAHPHVIEKTLVERINAREYRKAVLSSVAATASEDLVSRRHSVNGARLPIVVSGEVESLKRTKDIVKLLSVLGLGQDLERSHNPKLREGKRRSASRRLFRKSALLVVKEDNGAIRAARNIAGVDACTLQGLRASLLAPGGQPGRITIWSENAIKSLDEEVSRLKL